MGKDNIIKFPTASMKEALDDNTPAKESVEVGKDNVTDLKFVEVPTLLSEGVFGISVNNVVHSTVMGNMVVFWFNEDHMDGEHGWDLQVPFATAEEAQESLDMFHEAARQIKFKRIK